MDRFQKAERRKCTTVWITPLFNVIRKNIDAIAWLRINVFKRIKLISRICSSEERVKRKMRKIFFETAVTYKVEQKTNTKKKDSIEKKEKENREKSQTKLIEFFVLFSAKENNVT